MKTLYLHIGTHKTGTTAIQEFLAANKKALLAQSYTFPMLSHRVEGITRVRNGHWFAAQGWDEEHKLKLKDIQLEFLAEGFASLERAFAKADNAIVSDERIYLNATNNTQRYKWDGLMQHAAQHGYQVRVIVYLRRQDDYLMSFYKQRIKDGSPGSNISFPEFLENCGFTKPNYAKTLGIIADKVGKENIIVRVYNRANFPSGDVVKDFLNICGVEFTNNFVEPNVEPNPSANANLTEIKRYTLAIPLQKRTRSIVRKASVEATAHANKEYKPTLLSQEQTTQILEQYAQGNAQIAREYLNSDEPLFGSELSSAPVWSFDNPYILEDTVRFMASVVNQQQTQIDALRARVEALEKHTMGAKSLRDAAKDLARSAANGVLRRKG